MFHWFRMKPMTKHHGHLVNISHRTLPRQSTKALVDLPMCSQNTLSPSSSMHGRFELEHDTLDRWAMIGHDTVRIVIWSLGSHLAVENGSVTHTAPSRHSTMVCSATSAGNEARLLSSLTDQARLGQLTLVGGDAFAVASDLFSCPPPPHQICVLKVMVTHGECRFMCIIFFINITMSEEASQQLALEKYCKVWSLRGCWCFCWWTERGVECICLPMQSALKFHMHCKGCQTFPGSQFHNSKVLSG